MESYWLKFIKVTTLLVHLYVRTKRPCHPKMRRNYFDHHLIQVIVHKRDFNLIDRLIVLIQYSHFVCFFFQFSNFEQFILATIAHWHVISQLNSDTRMPWKRKEKKCTTEREREREMKIFITINTFVLLIGRYVMSEQPPSILASGNLGTVDSTFQHMK